MKKKIKEVAPYKTLYVDENTGLAMIEDGVHGQGLSLHPNIDRTGSVKGMVKLGYWKEEDRKVKAFGGIYNIDRYVAEDNAELNAVLLAHCRCGGDHGKETYPEAGLREYLKAKGFDPDEYPFPPIKEEWADFPIVRAGREYAFLKYLEPGSPTLAAVLREHWEKGKRYYIDKRVNIEGHRREFNKLNDMMTGG